MKKQINPRGSGTRSLKRLALLGATTLLAIGLTACGGGGGGGVTGPVPVTPTVTCAGQSAPTVTSPSSCPALSPAPTVTTVGGVLTLSLPPGAQLASASTLTVNAGGTGVVSLAVSAAGVITPAALPCGGAGQLLCSTSYPVSGALNFTNAPAVMINTSVMTPAAPLTTAALCAASGPNRELFGTAAGSIPYCATVLPIGAYIGETSTFNGRTMSAITPEWPALQTDGTICPSGPSQACFRAAVEAGKVIFVQSGLDNSNIVSPIFKRVLNGNMVWSFGNPIDKRTGIIAWGDPLTGWNFSNQKIDYYKGTNSSFEVHGNGDSPTSCYEFYLAGNNPSVTSGWGPRSISCTP